MTDERDDRGIGATYTISDNQPRVLIFYGGAREVMRITPDGELIVNDPSEAARTLKREWERLIGIRANPSP